MGRIVKSKSVRTTEVRGVCESRGTGVTGEELRIEKVVEVEFFRMSGGCG